MLIATCQSLMYQKAKSVLTKKSIYIKIKYILLLQKIGELHYIWFQVLNEAKSNLTAIVCIKISNDFSV